jgi:hypothetical protein
MQTVKGPIWASFFTSPVLWVPTICLQVTFWGLISLTEISQRIGIDLKVRTTVETHLSARCSSVERPIK